MQKINWYSGMAVFGGCLLALMIHLNSQLALGTTGLSASWFAHGIGAVTAWILLSILGPKRHAVEMDERKAPRLFYLGGIPGAFTVILASITVNSSIGLSGTLALGLIGQLIFSLICERFGWLQLEKKTFSMVDFVPIVLIVLGSILLIYARV
ncbi:DMT family transporter [Vibrio sp. F74]|uniref:DMT family transporter n=1 Tax=Vibrio sp. F74 TaxID=700020 RepID=UPI0035F5E873